ncbi:MAG: PKD domain-containing protein, partial [bacterium]
NDQPVNVSAGADQYLCADSTRLYASEATGGSGRWSIAMGSAAFSDNTAYDARVYNLEKGENRLVWTTTINGCSASDTVMVMNNLPSLSSAGPDQDNCSPEAFMAANSPQIGTGKWSVVSGSAIFEDPSDPLTKITSAGNGTNLLRWTTTNGNCNLSDDVKILNSLPTLAYAGKDRAVCNNSANLLANPPTTGTGTWKVVSGFGVIEDPGNYNTQINNLGFGANTIRWTTENGRCKTSDDIIISNNLAVVNAGEDKIVYSPEVNLVGNKPSSGTGEWQLVAGSGSIQSPMNFESKVKELGEGANTFLWTIDNNGCIASDDIIVSYYELPEIDFSISTSQGCPPLKVDFINSSIGGNPYNWKFGDGTESSETNPTHTFTIPGEYQVRLTGTGPDGIMITKDTTIIVSEQPVAEMDITPHIVYISENEEENEPVHFFTLTYNADSVIWDFGDGEFSNEKNPQHYYRDTGIYNIRLEVITGNHCYDSKIEYEAVKVEQKGQFECPNAFTPNMEGPSGQIITGSDYSNDMFHCYADGLLEYHIEIYNRLGILLFENDNINIGWDGYFHGELVEEGVYVYKVSGRFNNGENFSETGVIMLIHQE